MVVSFSELFSSIRVYSCLHVILVPRALRTASLERTIAGGLAIIDGN